MTETIALLKRLEFRGHNAACPECRRTAGHAPDCALARLIAETEAEPSEADRLRAALQAIADAETGISNGDYEWPCAECQQMQWLAREALEGK